MAVQVALEVEVRQGLALADEEQLLERRIRLDVVLVLQGLLLHVVVHTLRHLRAAHQSALGLHEEGAELIRHLDGALEDGRRTLGRIRALLHLRAALALAGILDLAVYALVELLHLAEQEGHRLAESGELGGNRLQVLIQSGRGAGDHGTSGLLHRGGGHHHRRRRSGGGRGRGGLGGLRRLRGLRGLGHGRSGHGRSSHRGGHGHGLRRSSLLRDGLRGSRTHYTRDGGSLRGHFTHYTCFLDGEPSIFIPRRSNFYSESREYSDIIIYFLK